MRALVIDDSRAIRSIIGKILRELGYEVLEAAHGREGLDRLRVMDLEVGGDTGGPGALPDVVLVDWNMPEMNGYEFVKAVRAEDKYAQVPLLMVTTESEISQVQKALEAGANEFLMKPFTKDNLVDKLGLIGIKSAS